MWAHLIKCLILSSVMNKGHEIVSAEKWKSNALDSITDIIFHSQLGWSRREFELLLTPCLKSCHVNSGIYCNFSNSTCNWESMTARGLWRNKKNGISSSEDVECPVFIYLLKLYLLVMCFLNMYLCYKGKIHIFKIYLLWEWKVTLSNCSFCLQRTIGGNVGINLSVGHGYCSF